MMVCHIFVLSVVWAKVHMPVCISATVHTSVTCSNSSEFMPSYFTKPFSRHQKFSSVTPNRLYSTFDSGLALNSLTSPLVLPNYLKLYFARFRGYEF